MTDYEAGVDLMNQRKADAAELKRYREREPVVQALMQECDEWMWAMAREAQTDIAKVVRDLRCFDLGAAAAPPELGGKSDAAAADAHVGERTHAVNGDRMIEVCAECLCAACWHGEFMCERSRSAGTVRLPTWALDKLRVEAPHNYSEEKVRAVCGSAPR